MTDSMNFGPDWIRNLSSEGTTGGGTSSGPRYQLADYRYGREEMLALFDKTLKPPQTLSQFKALYSEQALYPLALLPNTEEEVSRGWQSRPNSLSGPPRGRGGSMDRGGRISRGRGGYQSYGRPTYDSGWGNGEQPDWSPRKDFSRSNVADNWRRNRTATTEEEDGWRNTSTGRALHEKWGRSTSWRGEGDSEERSGPPERGGRASWHDMNRGPSTRRSWESEDHLPEWATENPTEGGGTFDSSGAFHGSDDEQVESNSKSNKREPVCLQKSTSQQHITTSKATHHPALVSSKSAVSLIKQEEHEKHQHEDIPKDPSEQQDIKENGQSEREKPEPNIPRTIDKEVGPGPVLKEKTDSIQKINDKSTAHQICVSNGPVPVQNTISASANAINKSEEEFDKFQEDLVLKLVVDEEPPKPQPTNAFDVTNVQPPPNLQIPEKWYYQDPQGQMQGPFHNVEMAEWYKAGYFSHQLKVRRQCDERFVLLGELISLCGGDPFQTTLRLPPFKNEGMPAEQPPELLQYQQLFSSLGMKQQPPPRVAPEPWNSLNIQQPELPQQRLQMLQPQPISSDLSFMQQQNSPNPLMLMINKMQQANKLPGHSLIDKPTSNVSHPMDPLMVQMGNYNAMQGRIPSGGLSSTNLPTGPLNPTGIPSGLASAGLPNQMQSNLAGSLPTNLPGNLPAEGLAGSLPNLQPGNMGNGSLPLSSMQSGLPMGLTNSLNVPRPKPLDQLPNATETDPISNLLKQLQQQKQVQPIDSLWQQNQFSVPPANTAQQWQQPQPTEPPHSMWDMPPSAATPNTSAISASHHTHTKYPASSGLVALSDKLISDSSKLDQEKERKAKEDISVKEMKRKKEQDDKVAKREVEEKRKQDQRKQELEKKASEEKKKKEEEKIRKELEKHKKEAEEKRLRELEEKRRLKEQRKIEEENKKRSEELKKQEEDKARREQKEREEFARKQSEAVRLQEHSNRSVKPAPWSQSNSTLGLSLTEIQKAEKERKAQEAALQLQRQQLLQEQQLQQIQEKPVGMSWAKKPIEHAKVKSLAEIQAEEQERLKQAAEARLAAQHKEKEAPVTNPGNIWNGQNLTWASASSNNQWLGSTGGFWEDVSQKSKPSVSKSSSSSALSNSVKHQTAQVAQSQQQVAQAKQAKNKPKKEEQLSKATTNNNNNHGSNEFTNWCYKTLANITTSVDVPTFVTFLRDIESAFDVREYCKEYLGDSPATQQFASNFLEKRRLFKPRNNAHKDDMCSPAPAITPSSVVHSNEFQEVKGKNKKNKKSRMYKVDSRILGFNVTSATDRINVGDRDYGDNS